MCRYLFISILCLAATALRAQTADERQQRLEDEQDEIPEPRIIVRKDRGLAVGIDLSPFIMRIIDEETTGLAFCAHYGIVTRLFAGGEVGYENTKYSSDDFQYTSNGTFIRIGLDYDIFNSETFPTNDNVFFGFRYCYAWQSHKCDDYTIVDAYWGDLTGSVGNSSVNSHSLDILFGVRCEMLRCIYMGWTFRGRFLLASKHDDALDPYSVAGYGTYSKKANMGFTYTIEYQIPFNRKKTK